MSILDVADGMGRVDTILVCVAPPDGPAIAAALRDRGFAVVEAPTSMLGARAVGEVPQVMIVDLDPPGALDIVERAREASPRSELLCVGDAARAAEIGFGRADGRVFERPVDLEALALAVVALAEPAVDLQKLGSAPSLQPDHAASAVRETSPPKRGESDVPPPASEYPSTSDPLEVAAILPAFDDPENLGNISPIDVSPELAQLLEAAEQRVNVAGLTAHSSIPAPDEELDLILPAEMLAVLDEPLAPEDEVATGGSAQTGGTGFPRPRTTGEGGLSATPPPTGTGTMMERGSAPETNAGLGSAMPPPLPPPTANVTDTATGAQTSANPRTARAPITMAPQASPSPSAVRAPAITEPQVPPVIPSAAAARPPAPPSNPPPARITSRPEPVVDRPAVSPGTIAASTVTPPFGVAVQSMPSPAPSAIITEREREASAEEPALPRVLTPGDAIRAIAAAIAGRASGSLALGNEAAMRRIVLHDGDVVTAASTAPEETLVSFLAARGDLERDVGARLAGRLPAFGRHAGAALIAHGHLGQDDLWPVLRAHAEWIIGRALANDEGTCELEAEAPGRLKAEPSVFGGATGAEVMLEAIRRVLPPKEAEKRLGGLSARLAAGPRHALLAECALSRDEEAIVRSAAGRTVGEVLSGAAPELLDVLYGLVALGVLEALAPSRRAEPAAAEIDPLDEEAVRQRVRARLSLVEDGDYFALLGIPRGATGYEIRRAYLELRRAFEPARVLTAATADLAHDVQVVIEVLDEAYEILREPHRRERYRRAIEAGPP